MKIYTKTGDKGQTGIIGKRISKASKLIDALGSLDELNASLGIVIYKVISEKTEQKLLKKIEKDLEDTQSIIFSIGGILAGGRIKLNLKLQTKKLESRMDKMDKELEPLQNFILPGGSNISSSLHLSRAICRRAERRLVDYFEEISLKDESEILPFVNRLSDYFFTLARYINLKSGFKETIWNSRNSK